MLTNTLYIQGVEESDLGSYRCYLADGRISKYSKITVKLSGGIYFIHHISSLCTVRTLIANELFSV